MDMSIIKVRQDWVLRNPCEKLQDCGKPGYVSVDEFGALTVVTSLTIDLFSDPLGWHAQAIRLINGKPVELYGQDVAAVQTLGAIASSLVYGVGIPTSQQLTTDKWAVNYFRSLTLAEVEKVLAFADANRRSFEPGIIAIGELNEYDMSNRKTRVGDGLHIPINRKVINVREA